MDGFSARRPASSDSLDLLYRRHADWLRRRLRARFGDTAADDLVQETYVRVARRAHDADEVLGRPFLMRVALNLIRDDHRRAQVRRAAAEGGRLPENDATAPLGAERLILVELLASMPETYRDAFVLHRFEGWSYAQIAQARQISVKTVEYRISQALAHCAASLDNE